MRDDGVCDDLACDETGCYDDISCGEVKFMHMSDKIIKHFKEYNPRLTVVAIYRFMFRYYVIAMYHPEHQDEMDPYYVYNPFMKNISGFSVVEHLRLYGLIFRDKNLVFARKR